jgi:hypothetical protein
LEEILDLMRGDLQSQDANNLRVLDEERMGQNREPQPDMSSFKPQTQWW